MFTRTVSPDDLARLKQDREDANEQYNVAIRAVEGALQQLRELPHPPPAYDEHLLAAVREQHDPSAGAPRFSRGWRGRIQSLIWRKLVWPPLAPVIESQRARNQLIVDHLARNTAVHREVPRAIASVIDVIREELAKTVQFQARMLSWAQALTPFIDTKDYEISGLMRRINEDVAEVNLGLAATVDGVADELRKRWETTLARERRLEAHMDELHQSVAIAHQVAQTLKREMGRVSGHAGSQRDATVQPGQPAQPTTTPSAHVAAEGSAVDSYKYVGFEDRFRGSATEIRARLEAYVPLFEGAKLAVLDAGCGRGEFLQLLREHGVPARGIDVNHEMVEHCRARELDADETDLRSYLAGLSDGALGGLFAAQVVEHLEPDYLLEVLSLAYDKLAAGSCLVLETINVASWSAFFQSYIRDITHVRPLHPDTLQYLVTASGFQKVEVVYRSPSPPQDRLDTIKGFVPAAAGDEPSGLGDLVTTFNENVEKLNRLLFSDQDYAVIGRRM